MQLLIIIFGFHIFQLNSEAIHCEVQKAQPVITCHQYHTNCFIFEGNEEDYQQLKSVDKEIIQKSFIIPYKDTPISTKVFKFLDYVKIQEKLICSLFLNSLKYYITCISFDTLDFEKNYGSNQEKLKIETTISSEEICVEIHQLNQSFYLICLSKTNLKLYSVNLKGDTILINELDVSIQIEDQCKMKQQKIQKKHYFIIAFFQCSQWTIVEINNKEMKIILQSKMNENIPSIQEFSKVDDVQICDSATWFLHLIEGNNYSHFNTIYSTFKLDGATMDFFLNYLGVKNQSQK